MGRPIRVPRRILYHYKKMATAKKKAEPLNGLMNGTVVFFSVTPIDIVDSFS